MHNRGLDSVWLGHKWLNKSVKHFVDLQGSLWFPRSGEWPDEMRSLGGCYSCWCERRWWKSHTSLDCICGSSLYRHCCLELLSHTYCDWPLQKKWLWWAGSYAFAAGLPGSWPHRGRSPHLNNVQTKANKYCLQPLTFSFSLSSGLALLSTDTYFRLWSSVSILETMNRIRSLQIHGPHLQQYLRSILPVAPCSRSNPEGVVSFFSEPDQWL